MLPSRNSVPVLSLLGKTLPLNSDGKVEMNKTGA